MPGKDAKRRVSVTWFKSCLNPYDTADMPKYVPAGLTQHMLRNQAVKSLPYHVTAGDVEVYVEIVLTTISPRIN